MRMHRSITLVAVLLGVASLSGCGNYLGDVTLSGRTGLMLSAAGDILIRVQPCGLPIDAVDVSGPMDRTEKPQANPVYIQLRDSDGRPDPFVIDPANLDSSWVVEINEGLPKNTDALIIVNSRIEGQNSQTSQVSALIGDILALDEGMIMVGSMSVGSRVISENEFLAC